MTDERKFIESEDEVVETFEVTDGTDEEVTDEADVADEADDDYDDDDDDCYPSERECWFGTGYHCGGGAYCDTDGDNWDF